VQYSVEDLVRLAKRDNNSIRPYLYVNPRQGKHIPSGPKEILKMCEALATNVNDAYPNDALYVIGFAETATGVASAVSSYLKNIKYYQNTTREYREEENYLYFTESHSHAKDQMLRSSGIENIIDKVDRIIFIDDEVTTGSTICKLIDIIKKGYAAEKIQFSIVSILNSMTSDRISELTEAGIDCVFLVSIPFEYKKEKILDVPIKPEYHHFAGNCSASVVDEISYDCAYNPRSVISFFDYQKENQLFANQVKEKLRDKHYDKLLILGTEEFMYATICVGSFLEDSGVADKVRIHSTTRSPIVAFDSADYPLKQRYQIRSFYAPDRTTYIYNLEAYDAVLILTDAIDYKQGLSDLCGVLSEVGNQEILLGKWKYREA